MESDRTGCLGGRDEPAGYWLTSRDGSVFSLMTLRDGLIVRAEEYLHREEALEAVGLRE